MNIFLPFSIAGKLIFGTHVPRVVIYHLPEVGLFNFYCDKNASIFNFRRKFSTVLEMLHLVYFWFLKEICRKNMENAKRNLGRRSRQILVRACLLFKGVYHCLQWQRSLSNPLFAGRQQECPTLFSHLFFSLSFMLVVPQTFSIRQRCVNWAPTASETMHSSEKDLRVVNTTDLLFSCRAKDGKAQTRTGDRLRPEVYVFQLSASPQGKKVWKVSWPKQVETDGSPFMLECNYLVYGSVKFLEKSQIVSAKSILSK